MSKLSFEALMMRAEAVASEELMATISGGTENACHDTVSVPPIKLEPLRPVDNTGVGRPGQMGGW